MAVAYEPPDPDAHRPAASQVGPQPGHARGTTHVRPFGEPGLAGPDALSGGDALRRLASEVSGRLDLDTIFEDVVADAMEIFQLARIGLWLYDGRRRTPLTIAAHHGLTDEVLEWVSSLVADAPVAGFKALATREVVALQDALTESTGGARDVYARNGIRSVCFAPIIFRDEPLGLLVLYHDRVHGWTPDETALARGFADQMASAVGNHRLNSAASSLAARLEA
ncbi:MAG TPA: GAF domain-containing protein, partial [Candidatus Limnocylindrales bacterium]